MTHFQGTLLIAAGMILPFMQPIVDLKTRKVFAYEVLTRMVPFKIEFSVSQIIFFDSEEVYSFEEKDRAGRLIQSFRELVCNPV